ncbi:MAG: phytoene/squalene synthase family protein [Acidimicrobiia bacterium]
MIRRKKYQQNYQLTKKYGTSYFYATLLLPKKSRRYIYSLYSLCRHADDLVDVDDGKPGVSSEAEQALDRFYTDVVNSIKNDVHVNNFIDEITYTWKNLDLPIEYIERFFKSMFMDLKVYKYETFDDLLIYMDGSAAVIGEMVLPILAEGNQHDEQLFNSARALGNAFQLTNFIRDVGEDLLRGRTYIPQRDISNFGLDPENLSYCQEFKELMKYEIERNMELYDQAYPGVMALKGRQGACVRAAFKLYSSILQEVINNDYDTLNLRARVPKTKKIFYTLKELLRINRNTFNRPLFSN